MNVTGVLALVLMLLAPSGERDFRVGAKGESVRIHAQLSRHYAGEPLRFKDEGGRKICYDETGELTVRCVDRFYGSSVTTSFQFDSPGMITDSIRSVESHPNVMPMKSVTRTIQTVNGQATAYRIFGYDESGLSEAEASRYRSIQDPFWQRIREDIALNDRPLVTLYWYQTLTGIQLERIEPR